MKRLEEWDLWEFRRNDYHYGPTCRICSKLLKAGDVVITEDVPVRCYREDQKHRIYTRFYHVDCFNEDIARRHRTGVQVQGS